MTALLDVNVLVALAWPVHVHHRAATEWFTHNHERGWATTPLTESGFVRVSSNASVFPQGVTPSQATSLLHRLTEVSGHEFWPDTVRITRNIQTIMKHVPRSSLVTDAHLALLTRENKATLATFDMRAASMARDMGAEVLLLASP